MRILISLLFLFFVSALNAQCSFELDWEYPYNGTVSPLSLEADVLDRPYLYVASNEDGLVILSTSGNFVTSLNLNEIGDNVMNLTQRGNLLYVAIGGHFSGDDAPGIAIVDVSDPAQPEVLDVWQSPDPVASNGTGDVKVSGDYAYIGAMQRGLIILDISNPNQITPVSELPLDINYPVDNPNTPSFYNARGLTVRNDTVYMCHDAGGLRIIDCTDKSNPVQIGQYANPITYEPINLPRAYNNVVLNGNIAYVAVDYCGVEALDISDPSNIQLVDHYNLQDCPTGTWYNAVWHTNEMVLNEGCDKLFISSGRSELVALDVSQPDVFQDCGMYGTIEDTTATWGVAMRHDTIFLSYLLIPIYIPLVHPFDAKWNGIKMVRWTDACNTLPVQAPERKYIEANVFPNPTQDRFQIEFTNDVTIGEEIKVRCLDMFGRLIWEVKRNSEAILEFDLPEATGVYLIQLRSESGYGLFRLKKS